MPQNSGQGSDSQRERGRVIGVSCFPRIRHPQKKLPSWNDDTSEEECSGSWFSLELHLDFCSAIKPQFLSHFLRRYATRWLQRTSDAQKSELGTFSSVLCDPFQPSSSTIDSHSTKSNVSFSLFHHPIVARWWFQKEKYKCFWFVKCLIFLHPER